MTGGGPNNRDPCFTHCLIYRKAFQENQFGYASALAWILFVIIGLFTMLVLVRQKLGDYGGQEK